MESLAGDHLRGRGEQVIQRSTSAGLPGPSPRARGAGPLATARGVSFGTIPAGAGSSFGTRHRRPGSRDHPRGRGEQRHLSRAALCTWGPSPRARGADRHRLLARARNGTIPAGAGSSRVRIRPAQTGRDHPRGRGEQGEALIELPLDWGPSPRARGAGDLRARGRQVMGTIPAGAGSSAFRVSLRAPHGDQPRGRGEQSMAVVLPEAGSGPSPRARGAVAVDLLRRPPGRTIPAGAGSRTCGSSSATGARDHPRGRGEQRRCQGRRRRAAGPSPRARGAAIDGFALAGFGGTIPAGAGSSVLVSHLHHLQRDHPRGRGEQTRARRSASATPGPSPRARGAGDPALYVGGVAGTIPAGAGSSVTAAVPQPVQGDHPRGRGEQPFAPPPSGVDQGPSPRARGAAVVRRLGSGADGTIPAGAGSRPE